MCKAAPMAKRRRLNVSAAEGREIKDFPVRNAVECASAGEHDIVERDPAVKLIEQMEEDFLKAMLQGKRQVRVTRCDLLSKIVAPRDGGFQNALYAWQFRVLRW